MFKQWQTYWQQCCYLCQKVANGFLCDSCCAEITWLPDSGVARSRCQRCGIELWAADEASAPLSSAPVYCPTCTEVWELSERLQEPCNQSSANRWPLTRNNPLAYYAGSFEALLQWYKFQKELAIGQYFAQLLADVYQRNFNDYYIVPVPPRSEKLKREAWDQIGYLCAILHRRYRLTVLPLLQRSSRQQQKSLSRSGRLQAMLGDEKYHLALVARRLIWCQYRKRGPLRLLLLDDVYTTGSTMDMCHHALLPLIQQGWVQEVRSLSLCLVP